MQKENLWQLDEDDCPRKTQRNYTCEECGVTFHNPILATVYSRGQTQKYYACPRCITRVRNAETLLKDKAQSNSKETASEATGPKIAQQMQTCEHFFGYLNKHPKDTLFPDECLTCTKMVECLLNPPNNCNSSRP